jgi:hypothetical protein
MTVASFAALGEPGLKALQRGLLAQQAGEVDRAIECYRTALRQHPGLAPAHFNLGQLLRERGDYHGAAVSFEGAARLRPTAVDAWLNLGAMLERLDRHRDAVAAYQRASVCSPDDPAPVYNRGNALLALGDLAGAAAAFRTVVTQDPGHLGANWNLATALLAVGDFRSGWQHYEWRWAKQGLAPADRFAWPLWTGQPLADKRIVVWREQGLGDEILFATCLRELVASGAEVTLVASPRLVSLFRRAFPSVQVVADGEPLEGDFHYHAPIGALPRYVRPTRESFPPHGKFLVPESAVATRWTNRLDGLGDGPRVGICWRSGLLTEERRRGYSTLDDWGPLFELKGISWINLQYDDCGPELTAAERRFGVKIHRWKSENLKDDLESAVGLMWNLDAVVTAPTAVSSLAGGLGVPTWEVDTGGDWTAHGEDRSPWFPTVRVARRAAGTDRWEPVLARIATDLSAVLPRPAAR